MNRDAADPFAGPPPGAPDPDDAPVPTLLAAAWEQAEARLYPAVLERPDLYQRIVRLVRATADHLRLLGLGTSTLVAAGVLILGITLVGAAYVLLTNAANVGLIGGIMVGTGHAGLFYGLISPQQFYIKT